MRNKSLPDSGSLIERLDIEAILSSCRRYAGQFCVISVGLLAVVFLFTFLQTPKYEATAQIRIDTQVRPVLPSTELPSEPAAKIDQVIDTEVELLHNRALAYGVAKQFSGKKTPKISADTVVENITINRSGETSLININFWSDNPQTAAAVANAYAEIYLGQQIVAKRKAASQKNALLAERIDEMAVAVEDAERQVQNFKNSEDLMSVEGATLAEQSIASIDDALAKALAEEQAAIGRLGSAQGASARLAAARTPALEALLSRHAAAELDWKQARRIYRPDHPGYQAARAQVDQVASSLAEEELRAKTAFSARRDEELDRLRAEARAASGRRISLSGTVGTTKLALARTNSAKVQLDALERKAQAVRATYEVYLTRYQESTIEAGAEQTNVSIVSRAVAPLTPSKPNKVMNLILGSFLAVGMALSSVVALASMDSRLSTPAEIARKLGVRALPSLPEMASTLDKKTQVPPTLPPDLIAAGPGSAFAEQYRKLLGEIYHDQQADQAKIVLITSSLPDEGKTTSAVCLGRVAALTGLKAIVVDCDLRMPSLHRYCASGDSEIASEGQPDYHALAEYVGKDPLTDLELLILPGSGGSHAGQLGGQEMTALIAILRESHDLIILDGPPVLASSDVLALSNHCDTALLMCRWRSTALNAVEESLSILSRTNIPVAGVALSMVDWRKQAREGYGDPAFYSSQYGSYFQSGDESAA
ncbi:GumC family protein [Parasphingorhabdus halotolerans]|uniref:Polysaccharide biosynthesis tyrosine autokinase n=1 Tax=Parasphingorhabdus halotolerans TaxID=2725558 RepID=A0A6H2DMW4_9SPHN|nr:polysaccharide biosynthesis tyrosine autokinase [Parasphingorhabdus halotolerans]QJB69694.1 polysaccharide biosynthesis tyrosine autokinase [Parasphingorhabdus halotolerans]